MSVKNVMRGLRMGCGERLCCQSRLRAQRPFAEVKHPSPMTRSVNAALRR
jgi:hypothetical protein